MIRPTSFGEELMSEWGEWVLDHGLPDLPARVEIGESVPVAYWSGPAVGAVVLRTWSWSDDHADDSVFDEVLHFRRTASGWEEADATGGAGGGTDADLRRLPVPPRFAVVGSSTQTQDDTWFCCSVEGQIGPDVVTAEVQDSFGVTRRRLDSPLGVFVAATGDRVGATVVLRDPDGREVAVAAFDER